MVFTGREALALALMVIDHPGGWSQGTLTLHCDGGRNHPAIWKTATQSGSMEGQWSSRSQLQKGVLEPHTLCGPRAVPALKASGACRTAFARQQIVLRLSAGVLCRSTLKRPCLTSCVPNWTSAEARTSSGSTPSHAEPARKGDGWVWHL